MLRPLTVLAFGGVLSACFGGSTFIPLRAAPSGHVPRAPNEIEVFATGVPRPHLDLGLIDVYGPHMADTWIAILREEASKDGCDAVALGMQPRAVCVVFTTPDAAAASAPPVVVEVPVVGVGKPRLP